MDLTLSRTDYLETGIFGKLTSPEMDLFTLEHSYETIINNIAYNHPKIPLGSYTCVRGIHKLEHGGPFETFEITGIKGHTGLLFHTGNFNRDSSGCVLVALSRSEDMTLLYSLKAFEQLMEVQKGVNEFQLTVKDSI